MALRNQPYLPLYVQDILTDEKLILCSAEAHGVYLRLLCILHKQETYGLLCLKQKNKQSGSKYTDFAYLLSKQMPFEQKQIEQSLKELAEEDVIQITADELKQKRMVRDGELSLIRSEVGKKGGSTVTKQYGRSGYLYWMGDYADKNKIGISVSPQNRLYRLRSDLKLSNFDIQDLIKVDDMGEAEDQAHDYFGSLFDGEWVKINHEDMVIKFASFKATIQANTSAKAEANTENEIEDESEVKDKKKRTVFQVPTLEEISAYCRERKNKIDPQYFMDYQTGRSWILKGGQKIKDWKAVIRTWEKNSFNDVKAFTPKQVSPYVICERCGGEVRREDFIEDGGIKYCIKCPQTREKESAAYTQISSLISGVLKTIPGGAR